MTDSESYIPFVYDNEKLQNVIVANIVAALSTFRQVQEANPILTMHPRVWKERPPHVKVARQKGPRRRVYYGSASAGAMRDQWWNRSKTGDFDEVVLADAVRRAIAGVLPTVENHAGLVSADFPVIHTIVLSPTTGVAAVSLKEAMTAIGGQPADQRVRTLMELLQGGPQIQTRFMESFPSMTAEELARSRTVRHGADVVNEWAKAGRILSVEWNNERRFPVFQFLDGEPLPIIGELLPLLPREMSDWERAFWLVSGNGWLDGDSPYDHLNEPDRLLEAARVRSETVIA